MASSGCAPSWPLGGSARSASSHSVVTLTGTVGIVGVPHGQLPFAETLFRHTGWRGGPAPARIYIPDRAMDERRAIKSLVRVGAL
jgi:hypothetical protein